jgi:hypothetical protein
MTSQAPVAHAYNLSYVGNCDQEDGGTRPGQANSLKDSHLQNNQSKMDWRCCSSSRAPTLQAQSPEFKHQFHQTKPSKTTLKKKQVLVARVCNPSYSGGRDQEN